MDVFVFCINQTRQLGFNISKITNLQNSQHIYDEFTMLKNKLQPCLKQQSCKTFTNCFGKVCFLWPSLVFSQQVCLSLSFLFFSSLPTIQPSALPPRRHPFLLTFASTFLKTIFLSPLLSFPPLGQDSLPLNGQTFCSRGSRFKKIKWRPGDMHLLCPS